MLVLSRKVGETVCIEDGFVKVTVLGIRGNVIRLGFEAPKYVAIDREEIMKVRQAQEDFVNAPPLFTE